MLALVRRSIVNIARQPQLVVPVTLFPLMFAALNAAAMERARFLPGFPKVDSFLDFMLATVIVQGTLFSAVSGGAEMALDIEGGFFDRLVSSPVPRAAIIVGRLGGNAALAIFQTAVYVGLLGAFGVTVKGGPLGLATLFVSAVLLAVGIGGVAVALGVRTGSAEAVQAAFPVFFISLFMSSAFFPRQLMRGWFKAVVTVNPVTWLVESMRSLVIDSFHVTQAARAIGIAAGICVVSVFASRAAMQRRVTQ
jgi:ABC-2 type transport system permease protein